MDCVCSNTISTSAVYALDFELKYFSIHFRAIAGARLCSVFLLRQPLVHRKCYGLGGLEESFPFLWPWLSLPAFPFNDTSPCSVICVQEAGP